MNISTSELKESVTELKVGEKITLTGFVYTARDAVHKKLVSLEKKDFPFPIENAVIYYAGPTETKPGMVIGSCGPTTSSRMDLYTPRLLDMGLAATIGKGGRSNEVKQAVARNKSVYFCAIGGAGALAAEHIVSCETIAFPELGCESVKRLYFDKFPLVVGVDCFGNSLLK